MRISKIAIIVLAIVFLMTSIALPIFADYDNGYNGIDGESAVVNAAPIAPPSQRDFSRAIQILTTLDLMHNFAEGNFAADRELSRGELAAILVQFVFAESAPPLFGGAEEIVFNDVRPDAWYARYAVLVHRLGWMIGDSSGNFMPYDTVTGHQAVTTLVRVLGYQINAQAFGGFPIGYMMAASDLRILGNLGVISTAPFTRGEMAQLLYNTLEVPMQVRIGFGDPITYGRNAVFLDGQHNIFRRTGVNQGVHFTTIFANSTLNADEVMVGDVVYKIGNTNPRPLIGYSVEIFYHWNETTNERTLLFIGADGSRNRTLTIAAEDILGYAGFRLEHDSGTGMSRTVNLSPSIVFVYNGVIATTYDPTMITNMIRGEERLGNITLIDNTGNGTFDVAIIRSQVNYVVNVAHDTNFTVTDIWQFPMLNMNYETNENLNVTIVDVAGNIVPFSAIRHMSVLTVEISRCGTAIFATLSHDTIEGVITEIAHVSGRVYLSVAGETGSFRTVFGAAARSFNVGHSGTFFLDVHGNITWADTARPDPMYWGYILNIHTTHGLEASAYARIFVDNGMSGEWREFPFARNVSFTQGGENETLISNFVEHRQAHIDALRAAISANPPPTGHDALVAWGDAFAPVDTLWNSGIGVTELAHRWPHGMSFYPQIIRFELNTNGEIRAVDTFVTDRSARFHRGDESDDFRLRRTHEQSFVYHFGAPELRANGTLGMSTLRIAASPTTDAVPQMLHHAPGISMLAPFINLAPFTRNLVLPDRPWEAPEHHFEWRSAASNIGWAWQTVEAYRATPNQHAADVVVTFTDSSAFLPYNIDISIFERVSEIVDANGERYMMIHAHNQARPTAMRLYEPDVLNRIRYPFPPGQLLNPVYFTGQLQQGDIIRARLNRDGEVDQIFLIYRVGANFLSHSVEDNLTGITQNGQGTAWEPLGPGVGGFMQIVGASPFPVLRATVLRNDNGTALISRQMGGGAAADVEQLIHLPPAAIYVYDADLPENMRIRRGTVIDIVEGSQIVVTHNRTNIRTVVVYKNVY